MRSRRSLVRLRLDERGFTLPEVLVAMVMMLTVMFALYSIFDMSLRVFSYGNDKVEAVENARVGLERMEREIRATYPVNDDQADGEDYLFFEADGSTVNPPKQMPSSDQITFGNDLNGDGKIACSNDPENPEDCEYITYRLSSSDNPPALLRNNTAGGSDTSSGGEPVAENVDGAGGLEFDYLESVNPYNPAGSESEISIVRIMLEVRKQGQQDATQTLTTDVYLRNRSGDDG